MAPSGVCCCSSHTTQKQYENVPLSAANLLDPNLNGTLPKRHGYSDREALEAIMYIMAMIGIYLAITTAIIMKNTVKSQRHKIQETKLVQEYVQKQHSTKFGRSPWDNREYRSRMKNKFLSQLIAATSVAVSQGDGRRKSRPSIADVTTEIACLSPKEQLQRQVTFEDIPRVHRFRSEDEEMIGSSFAVDSMSIASSDIEHSASGSQSPRTNASDDAFTEIETVSLSIEQECGETFL